MNEGMSVVASTLVSEVSSSDSSKGCINPPTAGISSGKRADSVVNTVVAVPVKPSMDARHYI